MLLDRERERRSSPKPAADRVAPGERSIVCAACGHHITDEEHRIAMSGTHEHTFVNPAGLAFVIGCFAAAPGCAGRGHIETAFSWFPGWSWQVATCARCHAHVGWIYRNASEHFHGLILDALRSSE